MKQWLSRPAGAGALRRSPGGSRCSPPAPARASFLSGDLLDTVADWLAIFVLFVVPIGGIVLFWLVHILPEKIAEKRHHPQQDAIKTLCLLSLVFGGLLWPIAWLWAYTKPVATGLAYGTDKHEDYYHEMAREAQAGELAARRRSCHLREELEDMEAKGAAARRSSARVQRRARAASAGRAPRRRRGRGQGGQA